MERFLASPATPLPAPLVVRSAVLGVQRLALRAKRIVKHLPVQPWEFANIAAGDEIAIGDHLRTRRIFGDGHGKIPLQLQTDAAVIAVASQGQLHRVHRKTVLREDIFAG